MRYAGSHSASGLLLHYPGCFRRLLRSPGYLPASLDSSESRRYTFRKCFHAGSTSRRGNGSTAPPVYHPPETPLTPVLMETGVGAEGILAFPWQRPLSSPLLDRLIANQARGSGFTHSRGGCSASAHQQKGVSQMSAFCLHFILCSAFPGGGWRMLAKTLGREDGEGRCFGPVDSPLQLCYAKQATQQEGADRCEGRACITII